MFNPNVTIALIYELDLGENLYHIEQTLPSLNLAKKTFITKSELMHFADQLMLENKCENCLLLSKGEYSIMIQNAQTIDELKTELQAKIKKSTNLQKVELASELKKNQETRPELVPHKKAPNQRFDQIGNSPKPKKGLFRRFFS